MDDPVERQLVAYNAHDLDDFLTCFVDNAIVSGPDGSVHMAGHDEIRAEYARMFERQDTHAEILARVRAGDWVVDHERLSRPGMSMEVLVAYQITDARITRMIALR